MKPWVLVFMLPLLFSCSLKYHSGFIGKWEEIGGEKRLEFQKKMDWVILDLNDSETMQGRYELLEENKLKLIFHSYTFPGGTGSIIPVRANITMSDKELILTMTDGKISKFKKTK